MSQCLRAQSCLTLTPWTACSPPGTSVHGIFHARILEWVAISYSRGTYAKSCNIRPLVIPSSSNWFLQSQKSWGSTLCTMNGFQFLFAKFLRISVVVYPEQNWPNLSLSTCQIFPRNLGIVLENYIVKNKFLFFFFPAEAHRWIQPRESHQGFLDRGCTDCLSTEKLNALKDLLR